MEKSCSENQTIHDLEEEMDEEGTARDDNVDWVTVRQLVFNRLSFMFSPERIQKAMENTRKPNSNDWIRAATTKISSEWQELIDIPSSNVFPLVALPEDLLKRIFNQYCCTREMIALGLVSQQFRRCVNWNNKHYLTLDCATPKLAGAVENFKINGSVISREKWPKLVEILLDKTIITSLTVRIRERPPIASTITGFLNETMKKCKERPERLQFETITIHGWVKGAGVEDFLHWCIEHSDIVFANLRVVDLNSIDLFGRGWDGKELVSNAFKGKSIESIELNNMKSIGLRMRPRRNVNVSKVCTNLLPQTLRTLKTDSPEHSLLEFIHDTPCDVISGLNILSYTGYKTLFERTDEMVDLLWQQSPYLEYCTFGVISAIFPTPNQIAQLVHNIFQSLKRHSKTNGPITIELRRKSEPRHNHSTYYNLAYQFDLVLRICQAEQVLALLQDYDPETHISDCQGIEEIDKYGICTIKRGRFALIIEQVVCCPDRKSFTECRKCSSDLRLLFRISYQWFKSLGRSSRLSKKMDKWCLSPCQIDHLIEMLKKTFVDVEMKEMQVKSRRVYKISRIDYYLMIDRVLCLDAGCHVCHTGH